MCSSLFFALASFYSLWSEIYLSIYHAVRKCMVDELKCVTDSVLVCMPRGTMASSDGDQMDRHSISSLLFILISKVKCCFVMYSQWVQVRSIFTHHGDIGGEFSIWGIKYVSAKMSFFEAKIPFYWQSIIFPNSSSIFIKKGLHNTLINFLFFRYPSHQESPRQLLRHLRCLQLMWTWMLTPQSKSLSSLKKHLVGLERVSQNYQ